MHALHVLLCLRLNNEKQMSYLCNICLCTGYSWINRPPRHYEQSGLFLNLAENCAHVWLSSSHKLYCDGFIGSCINQSRAIVWRFENYFGIGWTANPGGGYLNKQATNFNVYDQRPQINCSLRLFYHLTPSISLHMGGFEDV